MGALLEEIIDSFHLSPISGLEDTHRLRSYVFAIIEDLNNNMRLEVIKAISALVCPRELKLGSNESPQ